MRGRPPLDQTVQALQLRVPAKTRTHKRLGKSQLTPVVHQSLHTVPNQKQLQHMQSNHTISQRNPYGGEAGIIR